MGDYPNVLGANVVWVLIIFGWTFAMMVPFFYVLKLCGLLRISVEEEEVCPMVSPSRQSSSDGFVVQCLGQAICLMVSFSCLLKPCGLLRMGLEEGLCLHWVTMQPCLTSSAACQQSQNGMLRQCMRRQQP